MQPDPIVPPARSAAGEARSPISGVWPKVSVVVPTRDRPELLQRAVKAVLDRGYPGEVECITVFDQSEPSEITVATPPGRSLRVVRNDRAPGLAGARNSGILAADGELVAFCDDDDEWLPGKLALQVEALMADPDAEVVCCGILVRYGDRTIARRPPARRFTLRDLLRDRVMELHPSTFLVRRRALLGPIGLVDEDIPGSYGEDYEWLLRAAKLAPVLALDEPLVRVHWHAASFFTQRWQMIIQALDYIIGKYPELRDEPRGLARLEGQIALAHAASGEARLARSWARRALRRNWRERRSYLALAVSTGLVRAETVLRLAHSVGRGV
jgi:glycosyltransferase involved in cell wall biosynthesis